MTCGPRKLNLAWCNFKGKIMRIIAPGHIFQVPLHLNPQPDGKKLKGTEIGKYNRNIFILI